MTLKIGLVAAAMFAATLGGLAASPAASAMPIAPAPATPQVSGVEQVRMVCDAWGRCWWRPNYYGPRPYYAPRYYAPRYFGPRYYGYGPRYRRW
ncbi:hypothetical protein [Bradyrhizobium sp. 199]|uniref:hypothetical protein n=1 Tax=Bradyrhizobium sp. 199 TaxID=2782664 RepID=UPI001FF88DDE|nr:hypothetical protein [Bradyrhizobium sp. 199]MCK1359645.1 hypothetical protein [Bradyrhizobium sp. 199]